MGREKLLQTGATMGAILTVEPLALQILLENREPQRPESPKREGSDGHMKTCPLCERSYPNQQATCPIDSALLIEQRGLEPGTVIRGKYRIVRLLGRGGMGTVYLAEHILLGRPRALKFISGELAQDTTFLRRFRREAQAAIELRHPNIVEVADLDQAEDGSPYIAMEYVDGPDLRQALATGAFSVERALAIARGIALGLGAAHAKGIVHRDVKPENILLAGGAGAPETPKLLDFGIAAMKESATAISRTRGLMLTPEYAAPEQWKGMAAEELDGRTDLYALGGVLHEMLTGSTNFHSHNTEGWMYQHLMAEPATPSSLRPELANWSGLDALVMRLLAKDRDERPRDVGELLYLLEAVHYVAPVARRETVREEPPPVTRRETVQDNVNPSPTPQPAPKRKPKPVTPHEGKPVTGKAGGLWKPLGMLGVSLLFVAAIVVAAAAWWETQQHSNRPSNSGGQSQPPAQPQPAALQPKPSLAEISRQGNALFIQNYFADAAPLLEQSCTGGFVSDCTRLGSIYENGWGVKRDDSRAKALYTKACEGGRADGCDLLGDMYRIGSGVTQDYSQAKALFTKACDAGNVKGCADLGDVYSFGWGVAKDGAQALPFYTKACDAGSDWGCYGAGTIYEGGNGVAKDETRAAAFHAKEAAIYSAQCKARGQRDSSCASLLEMYLDGKAGSEEDQKKANDSLEKLCKKGNGDACGILHG
jgi:serine/threonine protein kinase